jgi:hypothetical protein
LRTCTIHGIRLFCYNEGGIMGRAFHFKIFLSVFLLTTPTAFLAAAPVDGSLEESVSGTSTWSKIGLELYGWSYGSGLGRWDGRKPNADGSEGDPIEVMNQLTISYPTAMGMDFVVIPQFSFRPFVTTQDQRPFELKDPTVGIAGTVFENRGLSLWARFENALPVSAASRDDGMVLSPGVLATVSYKFARSGWELQTTVGPSVTLLDNGDLRSFLYFNPRVNYVLNDTFALFGYLETATQTERASGLFNFSSGQDTHVGLGLRYSVADLFIEPSINVLPFAEAQDASTTFVAVFFGGKLK